VKRDGTLEMAKASYVIDSQPPVFDVDLVGSRIRVRVGEPARKVTVALAADPRKRVELVGDGREFQGPLPGPGLVRVVVADMARNETLREVEPR